MPAARFANAKPTKHHREKKKMLSLNPQALQQAQNKYKEAQGNILRGEINQKTIDFLDVLSKNIALALSYFECQKCGANNKRLQFHHLILTCYSRIMTRKNYELIRHNYQNIVILCKDCHMSYHGKIYPEDDKVFIAETRIKAVKEEFYTEEANL